MIDFYGEAQDHFEYTKAIRRDIHRHPELGCQEFRTSEIISKELAKIRAIEIKNVAGTGVLGLLKCETPGPVIMLRFDIDALPIMEETSADYASTENGIMHACGHDGHTAIGLTVAKILSKFRDELRGQFKFIFQPAEEGAICDGPQGARRMINENILKAPDVDVCISIHLWNEQSVGWVGISGGAVMAGADEFNIKIQGLGGHAALPNLSHDPIFAASNLIVTLQSIVSRNANPKHPLVISVTEFHGGNAFNIIPEYVEIGGTIRSFDHESRNIGISRLEDLSNNFLESLGCKSFLSIEKIVPPVVNDPEIASILQKVASKLKFNPIIEKSAYTTMGSDDFALFLEKVKGCYIFIGSANKELGLDYPHHHPKFDFDEIAMVNAVELICASSLRLVNSYVKNDF